MHKRSSPRSRLAPFVLAVMALVLAPAQALGRALIRFMHADPGIGTATVDVTADGHETKVGSIGFGQVSPWRSIRSGSFTWALDGRGKTLAKGTATVGDGAYDVVVLDKSAGVSLGIYKASPGRAGASLVRVIHAAPELGSPELTLDSKPAVKSLSFTQATPYLSVSPGVHSLAAMKAGDKTPLVSVSGVKFSPGVAYSAIVIGSRGQRVRVVTVVDRGAPLSRSASRPTASSSRGSIVVKPGDSLWSIAMSLLPSGAGAAQIEHKVLQIWDRNAERIGTGDPNLIFAGQRLLV